MALGTIIDRRWESHKTICPLFFYSFFSSELFLETSRTVYKFFLSIHHCTSHFVIFPPFWAIFTVLQSKGALVAQIKEFIETVYKKPNSFQSANAPVTVLSDIYSKNGTPEDNVIFIMIKSWLIKVLPFSTSKCLIP